MLERWKDGKEKNKLNQNKKKLIKCIHKIIFLIHFRDYYVMNNNNIKKNSMGKEKKETFLVHFLVL